MTDTQDIRWKQRFNNYIKALQNLREAVELSQARSLTKLEQQGLIQSFEFTHELAWNVLKDYLEQEGAVGIMGSKDASRRAFKQGLIEKGEDWMEMIKDRNLTSHTYQMELADKIVDSILARYFPAFEQMAKKLTPLYDQQDDNV